MITTFQVGNRTVYCTDSEAEWRDLVSKGHVVYTSLESQLFVSHPAALDEEVKSILFQVKQIAPATRIVGVQ